MRFVSPNYEDLTDVEIEQLAEGSAEWLPVTVHSFGPYPWDVYQAFTDYIPQGTTLRVSIGYASNPYMSDWSAPVTHVPEPSAASLLLAGALLLSLLTKRRNHQCQKQQA